MKKERLLIGGIGVLVLLWGIAHAVPYLETGDPYEQPGIRQFDSLNVRFVGHWPFSISRGVVYDSARSLAFCGSGGGVFVLNVSDPSSPIMLSDAIRTRGSSIYRMAYQSNRLYIACKIGMDIWDVTDATSPVKLSFYEAAGQASGVAVSGDYAYLTEEDSGLHVVNVSDPAHPFRESIHYMSGFRGVAVSGNYAYVAGMGSGLRVINVSDPANPFEEGFCDSLATAYDVAVSGTYAYVVCFASLWVVNVSDPANPFEEGSCATPDIECYDVAVSGNYAYVPNHKGHLRVINVSDPTNPYEESFCDTYYSIGVAVSGGYAYVADYYCLTVVNVSDSANPYIEGRYLVPYLINDIACSGDYAYLATMSISPLFVLNVSDPTNPYQVCAYDIAGAAYGATVSGDYAYVAAGDSGLRVINVSDPAIPYEEGFYITPSSARAVAVSGEYAYVATYWDCRLCVVNASDPANPYEEGFCIVPDHPNDVAVSGIYAYVAAGDSGLRVINVSDPANPYEEGFCYTSDWVSGAVAVVVSGNYAYVAAGSSGIWVIDVSDPANPFEVGRYNPYGGANDVAVSEDYVYTSFPYRLHVVDVTDPANPWLAGYYETAWGVDVVTLHRDYTYVGVNQRGLDIYDFLLTGTEETEVSSVNVHSMLLQNPVRGNFIELMLNTTHDAPSYINIYSAVGQLVKAVSLGHLTTGKHRVRIPTAVLPGGVYFLQYKAGEDTITRKLILLR